MSDSVVHDLSVAYAQAKLIQYQQENPERNGDNEEIRFLLKAYHHACYQIPVENEGLDEHF